MPKGHVEPRTVVCRHCGDEFVTSKVGKAAFFCRTPDCDLDRGGAVGAKERRRRSRLEAQQAAEREREAQALEQRERAAQRREEALRAARLQREAKLAERRAEDQRRLFDIIREHDGAMLLFDEFVAAVLQAAERPGEKVDIRKAITALAHAAGPEPTWQATVRLAAECLAYAGTIPRRPIKEPTPVLT